MIIEKSLALYKNRPAIVADVGEKITLLLPGGEKIRVREKDFEVLHPGPASKPEDIEDAKVEGDAELARELVEGGEVPLSELAELAFGSFEPRTAWATWLLLKDGLRFSGTVNAIRARQGEGRRRARGLPVPARLPHAEP